MDAACQSLCNAFAERVVARDFAGAHALLAPWVQAEHSPAALERMFDDAGADLPPPREWSLDSGVMEVDDLRVADEYGPPSQPISDQVTAANYRGWHCIEFKPGENDDDYDACFDLWLAAVELDAGYRIGFLEPTYPD
jgi:hypothetical protein